MEITTLEIPVATYCVKEPTPHSVNRSLMLSSDHRRASPATSPAVIARSRLPYRSPFVCKLRAKEATGLDEIESMSGFARGLQGNWDVDIGELDIGDCSHQSVNQSINQSWILPTE